MDPAAIGALIQIGVAGVGLYLFATGKLVTALERDKLLELVRQLYEALIAQHATRNTELRKDRDEWKALALGTERRLDRVVPTVAAAVGAAVPSIEPAPPEAT